MALVSQISNIVNDSVADALGKKTDITQLDTSDMVSVGKAITTFDAVEDFYKSLTNRIVKTIYFIRTYKGSKRSVLRDEHEFGAFVQKVYYEMPDAVDNPTFEVAQSDGGYKQTSPYDVENVVKVTALIYGGQGTWTLEIIRPEEQIKSAFLSETNMMSFIDGIYMAVENKFKLEEERITALAVNTAMASAINGKKARNLLTEYNALTGETLTVAKCMTDAGFLKYACKEIKDTIDEMENMSTLFNVDGYETFTTKENLVVEMLGKFTSASEVYLEADTYHKELVALPRFEKVSFWQGSGKSFAFEDVSKISVKNDDLVDETENTEGTLEQGGIICFLHDIENVAAYFGNRRTWEVWNPRSEVMIHGEKARKGFAVDKHANSYVFYVAEA